MSALKGYLVLTESQFIDIVTEATTGAIGDSLKEAIKEERTIFKDIESNLRQQIADLQLKNERQKGWIWGLGISTGVLVLGGLGLAAFKIFKK